jgi:radical SAM-linked protein
MKILERAIRQSGLPIAFSQGFHPHPRISFGPPGAVGMQSLAEFFDMKMSAPISGNLDTRLNQCLPPGIHVTAVRSIFSKTVALTADICAADYAVEINGISREELEKRIQHFLSSEKIEIIRQSKSGEKNVDVRPLVLQMKTETEEQGKGYILFLRLKTGMDGHGRPIEILRMLLPGWPETEVLCLPVIRTAQWIEREGNFVSPMEGM